MKKMSKLAALLMTAVMLFSFWGCNNAASNATPDDIDEESANPPAGTGTNTDNQNPENNASASLPEELTTPLTLEAITDGIIKIDCPWTTLKYKINDGSLTNVQIQYSDYNDPYTEITVQAGDKVSLFASGSENRDGDNDYYIQNIRLSCADPDDEAEFYVYGNVMSLLDATNYATKKNIEKEMSFAYLFNDGFVNLKTHATKKLVLPATTLKEYCYTGMFRGCEVIEKAPELPATVLAPHCYEEMFSDCYELTTAPELPAATLVESCYEDMFEGCEKINYIKCLATDYSAKDCIDDWLSDVAPTGTFVKAAEANISRSEIGLPDGWSIQGATKYSITINNSEHGTVSANKTTAEESEIIKLTINSEEGYILDTLEVKTDSDATIITKAKGDDIDFLMPAENVSITATFKITPIGTKKKPTEVGDIVFNDGTALPASEYADRELTEREKKNAIAVVAYVYMVGGSPDNCIAVGLKQDYLELCIKESQGSTNTQVFSNVVNDYDNKSAGDVRDYICNGDGNLTDYSQENYPAFYWAQHYTGYNNLGTITNDWLLPNLSDFIFLSNGKAAVENAISKIGSNYAMRFVNADHNEYLTVTQFPDVNDAVYVFNLETKKYTGSYKWSRAPILAIHYFQCHD